MKNAIISVMLTLCVLATGKVVAGIPSSPSSEEAVTRVRPALEAELEAVGLKFGSPIFIRIFKESRELEIWIESGDTFELFKKYEICAMSGTLGPKLQVGDLQAPEGFYFVTPGRMNPYSQYHLSFNLGYPNAYDRAHDRTGSALMVHGRCVSIGCFALSYGQNSGPSEPESEEMVKFGPVRF